MSKFSLNTKSIVARSRILDKDNASNILIKVQSMELFLGQYYIHIRRMGLLRCTEEEIGSQLPKLLVLHQ